MVILGLGSNLGDRLANLRKALKALRNNTAIIIKQVSPVYHSDALLPANAPPDWNQTYLNLAIACETQLAPLDLLHQLKNIEWSIGRKPEARHWGPRILDIDILAWDSLIIHEAQLTIPHENLCARPFALWPLADVAPLWRFPLQGPHAGATAAQMVEKWGSRFTGDAPYHTQQLYQRIDTPELVGIINVTPDSFSDGGLYTAAETAFNHALSLAASGATIIDIGAESTAPYAKAIDAETEWQRLEPLLSLISERRAQFLIPPKISIDTRHAQVAARALEKKVDWINDVCGLDDSAMREILQSQKADCVVMHHLSIPECRQHVLPRSENPIDIVYAWGEARINLLEQAGIARERIIFDPGIGFGKAAEQSLLLLQCVDVFKKLNVRLLLGHSRKTFLGLISPHAFAERDVETMSIAICLKDKPIDYLRVHNVEMCARGFKTASLFF